MLNKVKRLVTYLQAYGLQSALNRARNYGLGTAFHQIASRWEMTTIHERALTSLPATEAPISGRPIAGDAVRYLDETLTGSSYAEAPGGTMPDRLFVLHLEQAQVFPASVLTRPLAGPPPGPLPHNLRYGSGNLILTQADDMLAESLTHRIVVPDRLTLLSPGSWRASLPKSRLREDRPHVLLDLCSAHFGHALLDTPARLWALAQPDLLPAPPLNYVGFRMQGLGKAPARWPGFLHEILSALGIDPGTIWFPDRAVQFRSLYIPRRVSPFGPGGIGLPYFRTMRRIGDRIVQKSVAPPDAPPGPNRVYLSRRRLRNDPRRLLDAGEDRLEALFAARGFAIVHPQDHALSDQIRMIRAADLVAGTVGSQLHLTVFCDRPDVRLFRIVPSFFNYDIDQKIMDGVAGALQTHVVPSQPRKGASQSESSWRIDGAEFDRIARAVDDWLAQT